MEGDPCKALGTALAMEPFIEGRDGLNILLLGCRHLKEVIDLISPLARKLSEGVSVWASGLTEKSSDAPAKVRFRNLENGGLWDLVIFSPRATEATSQKTLKAELVGALNVLKLNSESYLAICVPNLLENNPLMLRSRIFGNSVPLSEEVKGAIWEEDVCQALEGLGYMHHTMRRLSCNMDISSYLSGTPSGTKELSDWLRVPIEHCRKLGSNEQIQLQRLCDKGETIIPQPKTLFLVPVPPGFERDSRAQPSMRDWWPNGDQRLFKNHGLELWIQTRKSWQEGKWSYPNEDYVDQNNNNKFDDDDVVVADDDDDGDVQGEGERKSKGNHHHHHKKGGRGSVNKVAKLSSRELTNLVEKLTNNSDRIELPGPMRLDDLLDVLVDVWDASD